MDYAEIKRQLETQKKIENANDPVMLMADAAKEKEKTFNFERYPTGIFPLDKVARLRPSDKTGGFAGGDIIIIAAPSGNGKTLMAATLSHNLMREAGLPSLWFTYEVNTFILWNIFENMGVKPDELFCVPLEHTTGDISWIEKKIKEAKDKYWAKVVVIDHLGFLTPKQKMGGNMSQNYSTYLTQVVRELKTLAVREDIIIILPVHMVKSAGDDPTLRDIGNSAGIAQESDMVILMARKEENKSNMAGSSGENYYTKFTKVIIAKNRIGGETPSWYMEKIGGRLVETIYTNNESTQKHGKFK